MLHTVTVAQATDVNELTRILRLEFDSVKIGASFLPGQWVNLHVEGQEVLRGYGVISVPGAALPAQATVPEFKPHVEVVIQHLSSIQTQQSQIEASLLPGAQLSISFGGSFVWPPNSVRTAITRVVFIAGGIAVAPLISMLSHIFETDPIPPEVHLLYASRVKGSYYTSHVLGLERLINISKKYGGKFYLYLFLSGYPSRTLMEGAVPRKRFEPRVMMGSDVVDTFKNFTSMRTTVCYVAGSPNMTSYFVRVLQERIEMDASRVLHEEYESETSEVHTEVSDFFGINLRRRS